MTILAASSKIVAATHSGGTDVLAEAEQMGIGGDGSSFHSRAAGRLKGAPSRKRVSVRISDRRANEVADDEIFDKMVSAVRQGGDGGSGQTGLPDAETLRTDVARLNTRLHRMNGFLLNPTSLIMSRWDICTLSALAFTATVTPYEVCMMWGASGVDALFIINQCVNAIFVVDIVLNFFLPYKESIHKGGSTIKSHRKSAPARGTAHRRPGRAPPRRPSRAPIPVSPDALRARPPTQSRCTISGVGSPLTSSLSSRSTC
jgi:hypothetical protein